MNLSTSIHIHTPLSNQNGTGTCSRFRNDITVGVIRTLSNDGGLETLFVSIEVGHSAVSLDVGPLASSWQRFTLTTL